MNTKSDVVLTQNIESRIQPNRGKIHMVMIHFIQGTSIFTSHTLPTSSNLLVGRIGGGASTGRGVRGTPTSRVVVGTSIVIGVVVRTVRVRVMVATTTVRVGTTGGGVVVSLAVGS